MKIRHVLVPTLLVLAAGAAAGLAGDPLGTAEAVFEDARGKDQLVGVLNSTANELHVTFTAPAGSTFALKANPDTTAANGASGIGFRLCAPDGTDLGVAGSGLDKSKPDKGLVKWKKVPLEQFGTYTLVAGAEGAGGLLMKLSLGAAKTKVDVTSAEDLPAGENATVEFDGRAGDTLKLKLGKSGKGSKFAGRPFQLLRPDGSALPEIPEKSKGTVLLDADGRHELLFTNVGDGPGGWRAKLSVKPRKVKKRKGLVSAAQTGLVPKVKKLDPPQGFNRDTALALTITGADLQPGLDVRLVRRGRQDILARDIQWISPAEVRCVLDLDTTESEGETSVGAWKVSVWNQPLYGTPGDRTTLVRDTPLFHQSKSFKSLSNGSVRLPDGVEEGTEVWQLVFNDAFQTDLDRMGLGSNAPALRDAVNELVQLYVVAYVRDLLLANETNGAVKGAAIPVSLLLDDVTAVAGQPGIDYNRIEIGGEYEEGDPRDVAEPLEWGFAPLDAGNTQREDLMLHDAEGTRTGLGVRTAVLDPRNGNGSASSSWRLAMDPLRQNGLGPSDFRYFLGQFNPNDPGQIARYADIVEQVERASREIAAIVAHHIGRAMGLATAGEGPMATPSFSGEMWTERASLAFADADLTALRLAAVPHELPGKTDRLKINFFPLIDRQPELLPSAETGQAYSITWDFVGGRCNAGPADYRLSYARGSETPLGLILGFDGLTGTPPTCRNNNQCTDVASIYCGILEFALIVEDTTRNQGSFLYHRMKVLPTVAFLPVQLQTQAQQCRDAVIQAP